MGASYKEKVFLLIRCTSLRVSLADEAHVESHYTRVLINVITRD